MSVIPLRVLALDDDSDDLKILERSLRKVDSYNIEEYVGCQSVDDAARALAAKPFDIIFVDYYLGRDNGVDVICDFRRRGWSQPAIAITGRSDADTAAQIVRAGSCEFLAKDGLNVDKLRRSIDTALTTYQEQRKHAAEERRRIESGKLEAVGTLAGGIAHDFNNMLTGLLGYLELAKSKCEGRTVLDDLEHMEQTCQHMVELARRMLTFVSEGAGRREPVNLHNLALQVDMIVRPCMAESIEFIVAPPPASAIVMGWPANLQEALLGILQNAVDAMPNGGRLTVSGNIIHTDSAEALPPELPAGPYVLLSVEDTGDGIPAAHRDRIFEPFFSTKRRGTHKGQGLGLAFVWKCVSDMGGIVRLESQEGEGTRFDIYFPLAPVETVSTPLGDRIMGIAPNMVPQGS